MTLRPSWKELTEEEYDELRALDLCVNDRGFYMITIEQEGKTIVGRGKSPGRALDHLHNQQRPA